jgi:hypothetical protein
MYKVNLKNFDDLFEAIDYCKQNPDSTLQKDGKVLMFHQKISLEEWNDIQIAKMLYKLVS